MKNLFIGIRFLGMNKSKVFSTGYVTVENLGIIYKKRKQMNVQHKETLITELEKASIGI